MKSGIFISLNRTRISRIGIRDYTRRACFEQVGYKGSDESTSVAAIDKAGLAYELIDAARADGLILARMVFFRVGAPTLDVSHRPVAIVHDEDIDRRIFDVIFNLPQCAVGLSPPLTDVRLGKPTFEKRQIARFDVAKHVRGSRHQPAVSIVSTTMFEFV